MRTLTTRALSWLQHHRTAAKADDRGAFTTAEALVLAAVGVLLLVVVVQPRLIEIVSSVLDTIQDALPS